MRKIHIKLAGFVLLWWQIDACFECGADIACVATLALFFGSAFIRILGIEIAGMTGSVTASLMWHFTLWLVIYVWLAPDFVHDLPFSITLAGWIGIALIGAWSREGFFVWIQDIDGQWLHDRSEVIVGVAFGTLAACFLAQARWNSVLPLAGFVLLPGLPFSFGWLAVTPAARFRFDAQFGDQDMFSDVGASDEF